MIKTFREYGIKSFLENLVGKRFSFDELREYLRVNSNGLYVELVEKDMTDYVIDVDYMLIGCLEDKVANNMLCDFDIYYTKTRKGDMYITEVGYEFE